MGFDPPVGGRRRGRVRGKQQRPSLGGGRGTSGGSRLEAGTVHHLLLHLAFRRAERLGVPLVVVHGKEGHDSPDVSDQFTEDVRRWQERFPRVEGRFYVSEKHPALALLDETEHDVQLLVIGRREAHRFDGFGFGSVTRAVLHYAEVPVLVVPVDGDL